MPKIDSQPKLVNRGPAGLLSKKPNSTPATQLVPVRDGKRNHIRCQGDVIDIESLTPDPVNARLHPERNMESIKDSLNEYGQMSPITVRKQGMVVAKGNGTLAAAKELGWTKIACSVIPMTDVEFAGYGLADNRTAELARWDFEVVARLDKLLQEAGHASVGWSLDELEVLRAADWVPPPIEEGNGDGEAEESLLVSFTPDQYETVGAAIQRIRDGKTGEDMQADLDQAQCLELICRQWMENNDA